MLFREKIVTAVDIVFGVKIGPENAVLQVLALCAKTFSLKDTHSTRYIPHVSTGACLWLLMMVLPSDLLRPSHNQVVQVGSMSRVSRKVTNCADRQASA